MDARKRETLILIEELAGRGDRDDQGYQYVLLARDYVEDDDLVRAREQLAKVHPEYFVSGIQKHLDDSEDFRLAVALLVDTFGLDLSLTRSQGFDA